VPDPSALRVSKESFVPDFNPYSTPSSELSDNPQAASNRLQLADRGTRLGAIFLDGLIIIAPAILLVWLFYSAFGYQFWVPVTGLNGILLKLGALVIGAVLDLAINGLFLYKYGQTIGKRICKIRIAKLNGEVPSLFDSFVKRRLLFSLIGQVPVAGSLFALVDPLFIFRADYRCIHDHVAGTIVVTA
jgi:uncharacterized RDD family membrane protein YckC